MNHAVLALAIIAALGPAPVRAQIGPPPAKNTSVPFSIPNYTANGGLPHWKTCRAKVVANTGNCTVLWIGESPTAGYGSTYNAGGTDARSMSHVAETATILSTFFGINASTASVAGTANNNSIADYVAYDTRVSAVDPLDTTQYGVGANMFEILTNTWSFNPANTATFPSNVLNTNVLDVYALGVAGGTGTISVNVNGGAALGTIPTPGSPALTYAKTTITGATLAANTWVLSCSGTCEFNVLVARNSAVSEASFINAGWSSGTVVNWNMNAGDPWNPISAIGIIAPALCILNEDINDYVGLTPLATFSTDKQNLITACLASGDVLLVTANPTDPGTTAYSVQQTYIAVDHTLATTNNIPILDMWANFCGTLSGSTCPNGGWQAGMGAGWNAGLAAPADFFHQGVAGASQFAWMISLVLTQ